MFYNEFKTLTGHEGWTNIQRLNQLRSCLSSNTAATTNQVEFICGPMTSERDLVSVIRFHVLGETCVSDSTTQLDSRTCKPGESIRDYAFALLELAELAYPGPGNWHVQYACEHFAATVSPNIHVRRSLHCYNMGNSNPSMETLASMATKAKRSKELLDPLITTADGASKPVTEATASGKTFALLVIESNRPSTTDIHRDPVAKVNIFRKRSRSLDRSTSGSRSRDKRCDNGKHRSRSRSGSRNKSQEHSRSRSRDKQNPFHAKKSDICYRRGGKGHYAAEHPSPDSVRHKKPRSGSSDHSQSQKGKKSSKPNRKTHFPKKKKNAAFKDVIDSVLTYQWATSDVEDQETQ